MRHGHIMGIDEGPIARRLLALGALQRRVGGACRRRRRRLRGRRALASFRRLAGAGASSLQVKNSIMCGLRHLKTNLRGKCRGHFWRRRRCLCGRSARLAGEDGDDARQGVPYVLVALLEGARVVVDGLAKQARSLQQTKG